MWANFGHFKSKLIFQPNSKFNSLQMFYKIFENYFSKIESCWKKNEMLNKLTNFVRWLSTIWIKTVAKLFINFYARNFLNLTLKKHFPNVWKWKMLECDFPKNKYYNIITILNITFVITDSSAGLSSTTLGSPSWKLWKLIKHFIFRVRFFLFFLQIDFYKSLKVQK